MNYSRLLNPVAAVGTIVSAASCPACFPALAGLGAALGLGVFSQYEGLFVSRVLPVMASIALLSQIAGWWVHRQWRRSLMGMAGPALVLLATLMYLGTDLGNWMFYIGVAAMIGTSVRDLTSRAARRCADGSCTVEHTSVVTCPECGHRKQEVMPTDSCLYFYECEACKAVLRPRNGDCCVFCSYGSRKCPPKMAEPRAV